MVVTKQVTEEQGYIVVHSIIITCSGIHTESIISIDINQMGHSQIRPIGISLSIHLDTVTGIDKVMGLF
jgi:hypothetical protein